VGGGEPEVDPFGRFAYEGLDRVLHEKARLGIMTSLTTAQGGLSFGELKQLCALSDGNLSRHLTVLETAGYVRVLKSGGGRRSRTQCEATASGRAAFEGYLHELERVLTDALRSPTQQPVMLLHRQAQEGIGN
jgi:DNA-binding MarR family transcriptional regulator